MIPSPTKSKKRSPHGKKTLCIIGGKWRSLKLYAPPTQAKTPTTRPSKAILKESCFNTLAYEVCDSYFIEGFAGSGSIGIEALSRGAQGAIFCEQDPKALEVLRNNLELIKIPIVSTYPALSPSAKYPSSKSQHIYAHIIKGDSFLTLPPLLATFAHSSILYLDPPFFIRENYANIYEKCASLIAQIHNPAIKILIVEHSSLYTFGEQIGDFILTKSRRFGKSTLTYFTQGA